jgi:hypothetical protein
MFVSELYCCNFKGIIRILTRNVQNYRAGSSCLKTSEIIRLKVNTRESLKSALICATLRQFSYVHLNSTLLLARSAAILRNQASQLSLQKTLGHIPTITKIHTGGIIRYFTWILWKIWDLCLMLLRVAQLTCVFFPVVILYPLTSISIRLKSIWYKLLHFGKNCFNLV